MARKIQLLDDSHGHTGAQVMNLPFPARKTGVHPPSGIRASGLFGLFWNLQHASTRHDTTNDSRSPANKSLVPRHFPPQLLGLALMYVLECCWRRETSNKPTRQTCLVTQKWSVLYLVIFLSIRIVPALQSTNNLSCHYRLPVMNNGLELCFPIHVAMFVPLSLKCLLAVRNNRTLLKFEQTSYIQCK